MRIEELTLWQLEPKQPTYSSTSLQRVKDEEEEERWKPARISGILSGTCAECEPGGKLIVRQMKRVRG